MYMEILVYKQNKGDIKMRIVNEYIKGGNRGSIAENMHPGETIYIAVMASSSKTFKSLNVAEKFMNKFKYKKVLDNL